MPDLHIPLAELHGFLLVLVRISGVFAFISMPGGHAGPLVARLVLAVSTTIALYSRWPVIDHPLTMGALVMAVLAEATVGLVAGVLVGFVAEAFVLGAQVLSLQAGYGYASTIDPATQADSGVLLVFAQLLAGLLFFTVGLDRVVISAFAASLDAHPPGTMLVGTSVAAKVLAAGSSVFSLAIRLAMPVIGLLLMVDLGLGLLGRISSHIQVISLAFPAKMLMSLFVLGSMLMLFPGMYSRHAERLLSLLRALIAT